MTQMLTHNHVMHCCFRTFTEGYTSLPKYTPHSESSRGKILGLSPQGSHPLLNLPSLGSFHFLFFFSFHFCHLRGLFILISLSHNDFFNFSFSSHNHDAYEMQSNHILTSTNFQNIILFTPIMFHNFQQFTQRFFSTLITTNVKENSQLICITSNHNFKSQPHKFYLFSIYLIISNNVYIQKNSH